MGIVRERQIEKAINEVDALFILINAVNVRLTALEERMKALDDEHRQRSATSGNRGRPRNQLRDG